MAARRTGRLVPAMDFSRQRIPRADAPNAGKLPGHSGTSPAAAALAVRAPAAAAAGVPVSSDPVEDSAAAARAAAAATDRPMCSGPAGDISPAGPPAVRLLDSWMEQ